MKYNDWADKFDIANINKISQYDDNNDGETDRTELEITLIESGETTPNQPYLIRAKEVNNNLIIAENTTLEASEINCVEYSVTNNTYTLTGTYKVIPNDVIQENKYYILENGSLQQIKNRDKNLEAFRWYLTADNINENAVLPQKIDIRVVGTTNSIEEIITDKANHDNRYYDLQGRMVKNPTRGIYICNGKKVFIK